MTYFIFDFAYNYYNQLINLIIRRSPVALLTIDGNFFRKVAAPWTVSPTQKMQRVCYSALIIMRLHGVTFYITIFLIVTPSSTRPSSLAVTLQILVGEVLGSSLSRDGFLQTLQANATVAPRVSHHRAFPNLSSSPFICTSANAVQSS
jgi:hypothetical protein